MGVLGSHRRGISARTAAALFFVLFARRPGVLQGQDVAAVPDPTPTPAPLPPPSVPKVVGDALWNELKRYGSDTAALVVAPFHWDAQDGYRAAGAAVLIGGSFASDRAVYDAFARNRSDF